MERGKSNGMNFVAGAVVGGAIGAIAALLLAPRTGEETRALIKKRVNEVGKDLKEMKDNIEPKLRKARDELARKMQGRESMR
ncbi:MAG: YtxH domain-containing protein [Candidatus Dojkabacteria bacterium]|jgi:gas vesicle protein|nr:YtxH domain-containing protein [Candidatus Dojkabacteria bacterium]